MHTTSSAQDGGIGRNTASSHNQKKDTTNLNTKNNQNCQKIKLRGTLTTNKLKKHSSRLVEGAETGSPMETMRDKVEDRMDKVGLIDQVLPHLCADKLGGTTRE